MTPLAHRIVKNLTLPVKDRCKTDYGDLMHKMDDVHCFDVTEAMPLIRDLALKMRKESVDVGDFCFLPAPKTWIEHKEADGRFGYLLGERRPNKTCELWFASDWDFESRDPTPFDGLNFLSSNIRGEFYLQQCDEVGSAFFPDGRIKAIDGVDWMVYAALALINTPRLIGRRQHMPHRGLERRLLKQQKLLGHFPLHAWTEIKLEVTPPKDASGSPSSEAHLTGRKALHFCRAHLRARDGRVEIVRGHWRGDAALGIKRSRYRLTGKDA